MNKTMTRILALALCLALCLALGTVASATGSTVTVSASDISYSTEAQTVTVTIAVTPGASITAFSGNVVVPDEWSVNGKVKVIGTDSDSEAITKKADVATANENSFAGIEQAGMTATSIEITYNVPAKASGTVTLGAENLILSKDGTNQLEGNNDGITATTTVTITAPAAPTATFTVTADKATVPQGESVTATLTLKTADALAAGVLQFAATSGTNSLAVSSITMNSTIPGAVNKGNGKISFGNPGSAGAANLAEDTLIATVTFDTTTSTPVGTYTVSVTVPDGEYLTNAAGGTVTPDFGTAATFTVSKVLTGIAVITAPTKTAYIVGDTFDPAGMVVTATYSDGSSAAVTEYTYPTAALATTDTSVTISYTENGVTKTATQAITVNAVTLESIAITKAPTKTAYYAGDAFDATGMVVTATYNNGSTAAVTGYTYPTTALATTDTSVIISYTEGGVTKTATQTITVNAVTLESIAITKAPTKTVYTAGDAFDATGMVVTATYNNGSTAPVTGYTYPTTALATTDTSVTISYTENGVTKTATQAITVNAAPTYTVTVTNDGHGTASADPASGAEGTTVTLTATPATGYQFKEWQVLSGGVTVTNNAFTIGTANVAIKAVFAPAKGDLNGDGSVTIADAQVLFNYLVDLVASVDTAQADVNGDGSVNSLDIVPLLNLISQLG